MDLIEHYEKCFGQSFHRMLMTVMRGMGLHEFARAIDETILVDGRKFRIDFFSRRAGGCVGGQETFRVTNSASSFGVVVQHDHVNLVLLGGSR